MVLNVIESIRQEGTVLKILFSKQERLRVLLWKTIIMDTNRKIRSRAINGTRPLNLPLYFIMPVHMNEQGASVELHFPTHCEDGDIFHLTLKDKCRQFSLQYTRRNGEWKALDEKERSDIQ